MKFPAKIAVFVLPFFLTACIHLSNPLHKNKKRQIQMVAPPIENTMPTPAAEPAKVTPPPVAPSATPPLPPPVVEEKPQPKPKPPASHHRKPAPKPVEQASIEPSAAATGTPAVSAIGQLSSGEPSELSRTTLSSIEATEKGLKEINRRLSDAEQKTASQIREFLKQARVALTAGDVDGAGTLAAKAKVLLGELTQ